MSYISLRFLMFSFASIFFGICLAADKTIISMAVLIITAYVSLLEFPKLANLLFLLSPLFPPVITQGLSLPIVNEISVFFIMANSAIAINFLTRSRYKIRLPSKFFLNYFLVLLIILIGAVRGANVSAELTMGRSLVSNFLKEILIISIYFYSYIFFTNNGRNHAWTWLIIGLYALAIVTFAYDKALFGLSEKTHAGYLENANAVGNYLIIALPFFFTLVKVYRLCFIRRLFPYLALIVIPATFSRGATASLCVLVSTFLLMRTKLNLFFKAILFISLPLVVFTFLLPTFTNTLSDWRTINFAQLRDSDFGVDTSGRARIWASAYTYLSDPQVLIFGGGADDFRSICPYNTQNHFLRILVDYGLIGLTIILIFYINILLYAFKVYRNSQSPDSRAISLSIMLTMVAFAVCGLFSHFHTGSPAMAIFWLQIGWLLSTEDDRRAVSLTIK